MYDVVFTSNASGAMRILAEAFPFRASSRLVEDGTPNFLAMAAVADGLRWLGELGMRRIKQHVTSLTAELLGRFSNLGDRVEVYGPRSTAARGGTIAFNLRRAGRVLDYGQVEAAARDRGIAIRGGCVCNPGAAEPALSIPAQRVGTPIGALRASIGIPTTVSDLNRLADLAVDLT